MKKLLLSLFMILNITAMALADVVTWDFKNNDYGMERGATTYLNSGTVIENGDSKIEFTKGGGNGFRLWTDGLRFMKVTDANWAKMAVRVPGCKIQKIVMTYQSGMIFGCPLEDDSYDWDNSTSTTEGVWQALTAFPEEVVFQSFATATKTLTQIEITYSKDVDLELPGLRFPASKYEVYLNETFSAPELINPNNLAVSYASSDESVATVAADGSVQLLSAGTTTITASSEQTDKYSAGSASYTLTVKAVCNTLAEFIAAIPTLGDVARMNGDLTVVFVDGAYVYVKDETASSLIFAYNSGYNKGDVIPGGWEGKNAVYYGLFEIAPTGTMPAAVSTADVVYPAHKGELTADMVNQVITLKNVTIEEATPSTRDNFNVNVNGQTIQFRNNFFLGSVEPGVYDIDAAVALYNTTLQIYPIEYREPVADPMTYRRKYTDSSSRYYTEISYTVNDNNTVVYSTTDPSQESYYVTPVNGSWQTEGAYIDMTDKIIEVPVNAENFTMVLKSTYGATHWSQNAIFVDWNNNGSFVDAGETNGVINISNKPNTDLGGLVAKGGDTDVIALPEGLKAGDTFTLLIAMNEPKGVDGTQDLWGTDWEWTTEIFNDNVCSLINGQAYALTVKITEASAPTVVSTRDYVGLLTVQIGEDGDASDIEDTTVHFSTMSDGTYSLLLEKFGADPSEPNDPGFGDIQIDGITLNGTTLTGSAPMLELMGGFIKAKADLVGELEGDDLTLHLDVFWLDDDGVTVLAPIYVDFTTIVEPGSIGSIDADNNAPVEYYTIQGVRVSGDNLTPGIYIRRQGESATKILVK